MLPRQAPDESKREYHKRLVYWKLIDRTLPDAEFYELAEEIYGQAYSNDVARRMIYGSCRTYQEEDNEIANNAVAYSGEQKPGEEVELWKERQKLRDERTEYRKLLRERSRQEELNEIISRTVSSGGLPELNTNPCAYYSGGGGNDLLISLNDIHYGANVKNYWNEYNSEVCADMMGLYLEQIICIAQRHKSENCIVWANGDMINGNIHHTVAVSNKENVIQQIIGVSELIAQFLSVLSEHFASVTYVSVAGNHSRLDLKDRALKDERLDDLVEWYLEARLQNVPNVLIGDKSCSRKIDSTMYVIDVRGKNYVGVHGDYDGSKEKVQSVATMVGGEVYAILSGHLHHNRLDMVQGIKTVMAGSFLGMDDYCVQKRIYAQQEQMVLVCDDMGILCSYDVQL